jgi:superfamily II DNA or RNA helicase
MPNIDKKNEIIKSLWPITMKPDGTQRYSYKTGNEDKPVKEFLLKPCLKKCIRYRRSTGAFTRGAMITWADHLYRIIEEGVKIDILTHLQIDDDIIQALSILDNEEEKKDYIFKRQDKVLRETIDYRKNPERHHESRQEILNYLIATGQLRIKFAYLTNADYTRPENVRKQFHMKFGYFSFEEDISLAFEGSFNETPTGHRHNAESAQITVSFRPEDEGRHHALINDTDNLWEHGNDEVLVRPPSQETLEHAKKLMAGKPIRRPKVGTKDDDGSKPDSTEKIIFPKDCWQHKKDAVNTFIEHKNGIFNMATGTGKTSTALIIASNLMEKDKVKKVIIAMDSIAGNDLLEQWYEEVREWQTKHSELYKVLSNADLLREFGKHKEMDDLFFSDESQILIIGTRDSTKLKTVLTHISSEGKSNQTLVIYDEVHSLSSEKKMEVLEGSGKLCDYKLGLSATPIRRFDEDGTLQKFLFEEVGQIIYEYELDNAIRDGILCEFDYHVVDYALTDEENKELTKYTKSLAIAQNDRDREKIMAARMNIANVKKRASQKPSALKMFIEKHKEGKNLLNSSIIFAGTHEHARAFSSEVLDKLEIEKYSNYFEFDNQKREDLKILLRDLNDGKWQCLVAVGMLSEGIDISSLRTVALGASDADIRSTIQRVGRALRTDKSNSEKRAVVIDFSLGDRDSNADKERFAFLKGLSHVRNKTNDN